jgi:DNA-binding transcriptional ArsR family regulator
MPSLDDAAALSGPRVTVRPSAPVELCWALHAGLKEDFRQAHPVLGALYDDHPDLLERAASFWDDDASPGLGFLELLVLAHAGDELFALDLGGLFSKLDALASKPHPPLALASESTGDRRIVLARLARLRRSARVRRDYATLLETVWGVIGPTWQRDGRRDVETVCADKRDQLARGAQWPELTRLECDIGDLLPRLVAGVSPDGELAVVPAAFTHKSMLFDLPGLVVVGVRADVSGAESRARTQSLARRLKTLADPTRLGIVDLLVQGPSTVSELARHFGIAQPTASNHVKLLRDAGLVTDVRVGTRRQLSVDSATLEELLDHLRTMLSPSSGAPFLWPPPVPSE